MSPASLKECLCGTEFAPPAAVAFDQCSTDGIWVPLVLPSVLPTTLDVVELAAGCGAGPGGKSNAVEGSSCVSKHGPSKTLPNAERSSSS